LYALGNGNRHNRPVAIGNIVKKLPEQHILLHTIAGSHFNGLSRLADEAWNTLDCCLHRDGPDIIR